ncbi:MAG: DUF3795 domain-containing protein [Candidatus Thorarchaeota archaeon]|jgi:hypothetical protein
MTESMISYCGIDCAVCPAHLAWKNDDAALRERQAKEWGSPDYPLTAADINCVGCKGDEQPKFKHCGVCSVRTCASDRGEETCAHCKDYGCDTLEAWLVQAGDEHRQKLDNIRAAL